MVEYFTSPPPAPACSVHIVRGAASFFLQALVASPSRLGEGLYAPYGIGMMPCVPSLNLAFELLDNLLSPICRNSMDRSSMCRWAILSLVFMLEDRCHVVYTSALVSGRRCAYLLVIVSVIYMYAHHFTAYACITGSRLKWPPFTPHEWMFIHPE